MLPWFHVGTSIILAVALSPSYSSSTTTDLKEVTIAGVTWYAIHHGINIRGGISLIYGVDADISDIALVPHIEPLLHNT